LISQLSTEIQKKYGFHYSDVDADEIIDAVQKELEKVTMYIHRGREHYCFKYLQERLILVGYWSASILFENNPEKLAKIPIPQDVESEAIYKFYKQEEELLLIFQKPKPNAQSLREGGKDCILSICA
jgi:hypothetical protein